MSTEYAKPTQAKFTKAIFRIAVLLYSYFVLKSKPYLLKKIMAFYRI